MLLKIEPPLFYLGLANMSNPFDLIPKGLLSPQTLKAYTNDWLQWEKHCSVTGYPTLPINTDKYMAFLESQKDTISLSTLNRRVATAKSAHKFNNLAPLVFPLKLKVFKDEIRARRRPIKQAPPLHFKDLLEICETPAIPVRNRALISIMFDAMLRGQDALELRWCDLHTETTDAGTRGYIKIWRTKGKWHDGGVDRALSRRTMELIGEYHKEASLGYKRPKHDRIFPIHISTIRQIFLTVSRTVHKRFTSHSPRVGATVEMLGAGISEVDICITAGWSSVEMVRMYARHAKAQTSGMTKFLHKKGESKWVDEKPDWMQFHQG